jgi:sialic acid synthase SpsE
MIHDYCYNRGENSIPCYFSVFDKERVKWCEDMGHVKAYKIAFSQRGNYDLIDCIKETGKRIVVSSNEILPHLNPDNYPVHYLYCIPKYPATDRDTHWMKEKLTDPRWWGFSDHFIGTNIAKIAISLGTREIEKHFAIDHTTGVDAPWSMTATELADLADFERKWSCVQ